MTQEELDALMGGDIDLEEVSEDETTEKDTTKNEQADDSKENNAPGDGGVMYPKEVAQKLPLPATDENKMVHQLDDVTKESEEKATEIFDIIETISNELMEKEETLNAVSDVLVSNVALFKKLSLKFPDVETFTTQLQGNQKAQENLADTIEVLQNSGDSIMSVMDIMQYQDIHRQKIERVINVMRALSKYMSTLFEGKIDDDKRVASATHIEGDAGTDVASTEDIEALLAQFGK